MPDHSTTTPAPKTRFRDMRVSSEFLLMTAFIFLFQTARLLLERRLGAHWLTGGMSLPILVASLFGASRWGPRVRPRWAGLLLVVAFLTALVADSMTMRPPAP